MKLKITINSGSLSGQSFELSTGHLSIGRNENCSIKFDPLNEKIASKQHAFIEAKPDGFYLLDNNSSNGTIVNGQKIQSVLLKSGDTIQFGTSGILASVIIESTYADVPQANVPTFQQNFSPAVNDSYFDETQLRQLKQEYASQQTSVRNSVSSIGLGNFELEPQKSKTGKYIGIAVTLFVMVLLMLIVTVLILWGLGGFHESIGLQKAIIIAVISSVVAFVPAMFYILPIIWLDRYDPEPAWLLALSFSWGALVAVILSFLINTAVGQGVASIPTNPELGQALGFLVSVVISAPIFEELTKGAGLLVVVLCFRKYFDGILDGIIFAGVIALGFATVENVLYYGGALLTGGSGGLIGTFIVRGVLSPFAHVAFTAMTGIGFGLARESHNKAVKIVMPIIGLLGAIALHAIWNGTSVFVGLIFQEVGLLLAYVFIEVPFFLCFVAFALWIMWRQNKIIREMLAIDVARGIIPEEHFEKATSAFKSTGWILGSIFKGKFRATSNYIRAIGKFGLSYWHIQRATVAQGQTASFQQNPILLKEVLKWKDQV